MIWFFKKNKKRESDLLHAVLNLQCCANCGKLLNCKKHSGWWKVCTEWQWDEMTFEVRSKND